MSQQNQAVGFPKTTQNVAYTGTAGVISNSFASGIYLVRVVATTDAFILFGAAPTATTSDIFVKANTPEYFLVRPGQKCSAIQSSAGGTLYVTEMSF